MYMCLVHAASSYPACRRLPQLSSPLPLLPPCGLLTCTKLGHNLLVAHRHHGNAPLWLFKSDVSQAYRHLPMHPLWQLKEVIAYKGVHLVDRCNNFGGRASNKLWCTFMGLVLWIAIHVKYIPALLAYIDDNFCHDEDPTLRFYPPYQTFLPSKQVCLLQLWDEIGLPHEQKNQEFGTTLTIC
jgi:hypothetical protein